MARYKTKTSARIANHKPSPEYRSWMKMRERCNNPNAANWYKYGGRGISVCARWDSFEAFLEDMGPRPPGMSLDRINNEGNYEPGNCRWATWAQQNANRRPSRAPGGFPNSIAVEARKNGVRPSTARYRISNGWSREEAVSAAPQGPGKRYDFDGKSLTIGEWAKLTGVRSSTLDARLRKGWSLEKAFSTPARRFTWRARNFSDGG